MRWSAFAAFVVLAIGLAALEAVAERRAETRRKELEAQGATLQAKMGALRVENHSIRRDMAVIARRDYQRDSSLRNQALLLVAELGEFEAACLARAGAQTTT